MKARRLIAAIAALFLSIGLNAQTFHLILFCNTIDEKIGESCERDHNLVYQEASTIADYLNYDIKYYDYYGQNCSRENLLGLLADLNCATNDIVLFYYSGHGVHAAADPGSFPQMCLKYSGYQQDKFVPVRTVKEALDKKNAQLTIILTDCCNNIADWVSAKGYFEGMGKASAIKEVEAKHYRQLFSQQKGSVVITGSKKGQYSLCNKNGGFFTLSFFATMDQVGLGNISPDWNQVATSLTASTLDITGNRQEPYGSINVSKLNGSIIPDFNNGGGASSFETTTRAQKLFKSLLDKRTSLTDRFSIADNAKEVLFARNAKVRVVGRDQKTTIAVDDVDSYLSKICLEKKIVSVSVISETKDNSDKYSYLVVHEVYAQ